MSVTSSTSLPRRVLVTVRFAHQRCTRAAQFVSHCTAWTARLTSLKNAERNKIIGAHESCGKVSNYLRNSAVTTFHSQWPRQHGTMPVPDSATATADCDDGFRTGCFYRAARSNKSAINNGWRDWVWADSRAESTVTGAWMRIRWFWWRSSLKIQCNSNNGKQMLRKCRQTRELNIDLARKMISPSTFQVSRLKWPDKNQLAWKFPLARAKDQKFFFFAARRGAKIYIDWAEFKLMATSRPRSFAITSSSVQFDCSACERECLQPSRGNSVQSS